MINRLIHVSLLLSFLLNTASAEIIGKFNKSDLFEEIYVEKLAAKMKETGSLTRDQANVYMKDITKVCLHGMFDQPPYAVRLEINKRLAILADICIKYGADVNAVSLSPNEHPTIISLCAAHSLTGVVKVLSDNGADPNVCAYNGETPLLRILRIYDKNRNDDDVVASLLKNGANPNITADKASIPHCLIWAIIHNDVELTKILLSYGANPFKQFLPKPCQANEKLFYYTNAWEYASLKGKANLLKIMSPYRHTEKISK